VYQSVEGESNKGRRVAEAGPEKYAHQVVARFELPKSRFETGATTASQGGRLLLRSHRALVFAAALTAALLLASTSFTLRTHAQFHPSAAPGFEINVFADPTNVPDFVSCPSQISCYTGPLSLAFDSRGRLFVGTGAAKILILLDNNEDGRADQVKTFATGLPQPFGAEFRANGDLYVTSNIVGGVGRVVRLRDLNGDDVADDITTIVDNLPSEGDHQTNRLKFGPDGLLYVGQGSSTDAGNPDPGHPGERPYNGSILRMDVDNPSVSVFATGLRNPFGMAFDSANGQLFATDIGSGELPDPDSAPDGISWIVQGGKYGFPGCEGIPDPANPACAGVSAPIQLLLPHITPTSIAFYTGPQAGDSRNQMLVTILKRLGGSGGDLRRYVLTGNASIGFQSTEVVPPIADFDVIDPSDGPVDTAIDPITGDIYVARFDPVHHANDNEHHHFIYRIHRTGSDALPFIGPPHPSAIKAGSTGVTISLAVRHVKPGAVVFDVTHNAALVSRQGSSNFELLADLPAGALTTEGTITLEVRNPDSASSNQQTFAVTKGDPNPPPPDKVPQITSMFVYKKKRANVFNQIFAGMAGKKLRLVVAGTDFDSSAQLLVNGGALTLESSSATELVGQMTNALVAAPGTLTVQVRNSTGKTSNALTLTVIP
jgi:glucose/arabinose dehydrogenase